jgi:hypothetical protein
MLLGQRNERPHRVEATSRLVRPNGILWLTWPPMWVVALVLAVGGEVRGRLNAALISEVPGLPDLGRS